VTAGDQARVTVTVAVAPAEAFRIFTQDVNLWWRRGRRFRNAPGMAGVICIEPGLGGRLFESFDTPAGECVVEIGRTLVWEPPHRLVLQWRAANFAPHEQTEVEVQFHPSAGTTPGTQITLVHRGWAAIRPDHPVRHAQAVPAFIRMMGLWWGEQLGLLRLRAAGGPIPDPIVPSEP
jgi:uncharacterized protein YndB with AHSA1/START domain